VVINVHQRRHPALVAAIRSHADLCAADVWLLQEIELSR
jgi:hypothetical protein